MLNEYKFKNINLNNFLILITGLMTNHSTALMP